MLKLLADASTIITDSAKNACGTSCGNASIGHIFGLVANVLVFLVGAIAVIMVIVGALRYVLSSGDPKGASEAKNTILYAVVGVVIALVSFAIVHFITGAFAK